MTYEDTYRMSVHAVISDAEGKVLLLKQTYNNEHWGLPGGGIDKGETVVEALVRECKEELGCAVEIKYLSGVYYHKKHNSHVLIFRCQLLSDKIVLSGEHSDYRYFSVDELEYVQKQRVQDCLDFKGVVQSRAF